GAQREHRLVRAGGQPRAAARSSDRARPGAGALQAVGVDIGLGSHPHPDLAAATPREVCPSPGRSLSGPGRGGQGRGHEAIISPETTMLTDIWTVTQKELKEIVVTGGGGRGRWSFLIFLGVFGVFLPLQGGVRGLETGQVMIFFAWVPFMLASTVIADTFAGERERHTLETLLATRLSDRAILFGKMFAAILYALGLLLASIALSVVTVNIVYRPERFTMYPPLVLIIVVAVSALGALLATGIGVLVSLRASTTRQAQQTMGLAIIALFLPFYVIPFLPEPVVERGVAFLKTIPPVAAGAAALAFVLVLNAVIIRAALARFKRSRLILD